MRGWILSAGCALSALVLSGCGGGSDPTLATLVYEVPTNGSLTVERGIQGEPAPVGTSSGTMEACLSAPTAWGTPAVSGQGTAQGTPFTAVATEDTSLEATAEGIWSRGDYSWYCYQDSSRTYQPSDSGTVSWNFPAVSGSARLLSTFGNSAASPSEQLGHLVVQDVFYNESAGTYTWKDVPLTVDSPGTGGPSNGYSQGYNTHFRLGDRDVISEPYPADGGDQRFFVGDGDNHFTGYTEPHHFDQVVEHDGLLIGIYQNSGNGATDASVSTDGQNWTDTASDIAAAPPSSLAWSMVFNQFVGMTNSGELFYSSDGLDWSTSTDTGAQSISDYVSGPSDVELVRGNSNTRPNTLFARGPGGVWSEVIPGGSSAPSDQQVGGLLFVADGYFFAAAYSSSGNEVTLYRSANGNDWNAVQQVSGTTSVNSVWLQLGDKLVVGLGGQLYVSTDQGQSWMQIDVTSMVPGLDSSATWSVTPYQSAVWNGNLVVDLGIDNNSGFSTRILVQTQDLQSFRLLESQPGPGDSTGWALMARDDGIYQYAHPDTLVMQKLRLPATSSGGGHHHSSGNNVFGGALGGVWLMSMLLLYGRRRMAE